MAKDQKPDEGEENLDGATSGKTGLGDMNPEQLAHLGGELDPIDTEDLDSLDRGDDFVPDSDEEVQKEIAAREEAAAKEKAEKEAEKDKDDDESDDDDKDKGDADDDSDSDAGDAGDEESEDEGDSEDSEEAGDASDSEDEEEEEGEAGEETKEPVKKDKPKEQQIPKSRFDEVNARRREAEEKLKNLEAEKKASEEPEFDFNKAETEYMDLLLSGKTADALAKRNEIRAAEQAAYANYAGNTAVSASEQAQEQVVIDALISKYEGDYAPFNPQSDEFSEDLMDEVSAMFQGYQSLGFQRPEAFKMALDNVVKLYDISAVSEGEGDTTATEDKGEPAKKTKKPIKKTKEKLKAAKKQPADPSAAGGTGSEEDDGNAFRIEDMTDEEIEALPPATLARLRGDTL